MTFCFVNQVTQTTYYHCSSSVVMRRKSSIYRFTFYLLLNYKEIVAISSLMHTQEKWVLNCDIYYHTTTGHHGQGHICKKKANFSNTSCYSHTSRKIKCMVMLTMKPSTKIVRLIALGSGVRNLGKCQYFQITNAH